MRPADVDALHRRELGQRVDDLRLLIPGRVVERDRRGAVGDRQTGVPEPEGPERGGRDRRRARHVDDLRAQEPVVDLKTVSVIGAGETGVVVDGAVVTTVVRSSPARGGIHRAAAGGQEGAEPQDEQTIPHISLFWQRPVYP